MSFTISKILLSLITPPAGLMIIILVGLLTIGCCRWFGRFLVILGIALLYCLSISPVSDALLKPLESAWPPLKDTHVKAEAIVVLGGGVRDSSWAGAAAGPGPEAEARLVKGIVIYRSMHVPLVLAGGNGDPFRAVPGDADVMQPLARALGVPTKDIIAENKSRNTLEAAKNLKQLVKARRIIVVTSAYHMKRAVAMFRKQGFEVVPAPAVYLSEQRPLSVHSLIPRANALAASSAACSEYLSLLWYSLNGDL